MAGTKSQGTRLYFAAPGTSWVALTPGSYPTTGFTQITRGVDADSVPHVVEESDNSCLNDTSPSPEVILKPGSMTFTKERDSQSVTLRGMCDGSTAYVFALVAVDGTADTCTGYLTCTSGMKASKGFANRISESYKITANSSGVTARASA